jgi:large subunit ribosomal protein L2
MGKRIIQQARGKGGPRYRSHSFRHKGPAKILNKEVTGKVIDIISCPGHSAPLAVVHYPTLNSFGLIIAPEGIAVNQEINIGADSKVKIGNTLPLNQIPEGIPIYNLEAVPGDGGKFVRASGVGARIITKSEKAIIIQLPSKKKKVFNPDCRATIGNVAGSGRTEKPFFKAGKKFYAMKAKNKLWPKVSGGAMNAVDHPFGNKRSSRKAKAKPAPKNAPPGRKVGMLRPRHTGRNK